MKSVLAIAMSAGLAMAGDCPVPAVMVPNLIDDAGQPYQGPGPFPGRLSGGTFAVSHQVSPLELTSLAGFFPEYDYIAVEVIATGPFPMTTAWHNAGDNDLNISMIDPLDPLAFPGPALDAFRDLDPNFGPLVGNLSVDNGLMPNYAWTPNAAAGVMMTSVATNFQENNYTAFGFPTGPLKAHIQASISRGGGAGYSMLNGRYIDGGPGAIFVSTNYFSLPVALEAAVPEACFWFPYCEGWTAGWVAGDSPTADFRTFDFDSDGDGANDSTATAAAPGLSDAIATWTNFSLSEGRIEIPGATPEDGMLFVSSADNGEIVDTGGGALVADSGKIVGVLPDETGYNFVIRVVDGLVENGTGDRPQPWPPTVPQQDREIRNSYSFVYVPYDGFGVIGAHVDGTTGNFFSGTGNLAVTRLGPGIYAVTIPGKTELDGGLMLQIAGPILGEFANPDLADRTYADYEWDAGSGSFIVTTFEMDADAGGLLGFTYDVRDADFYVAWVDYTDPMQPGPCDPGCNAADLAEPFGVLDLSDISAFIAAFTGQTDAGDLDDSGVFDLTDISLFIAAFTGGCP